MNKITIFKALSGDMRYDIVRLLSKAPHPVFALADKLDTTHSAISHQLAVLRKAKIARCKLVGRMQMYSMADNKQGKYVRSLI